MLQPVPMADLVAELRKRGEIAFKRDYPNGFLEAVYIPPSTAGYSDGDTAGTRLGGSAGSRSLSLEKKFIPLIKSDPDNPDPNITVGRAGDNDLVIDAFGISKKHAVFIPHDDGSIYLVDIGSANGTTVNGTPLEKDSPIELFGGDVVTIWWYVFELAYARHLINSFRELL